MLCPVESVFSSRDQNRHGPVPQQEEFQHSATKKGRGGHSSGVYCQKTHRERERETEREREKEREREREGKRAAFEP